MAAHYKPLTDEERALIIELSEKDGLSLRQIADIVKRAKCTVHGVITCKKYKQDVVRDDLIREENYYDIPCKNWNKLILRVFN